MSQWLRASIPNTISPGHTQQPVQTQRRYTCEHNYQPTSIQCLLILFHSFEQHACSSIGLVPEGAGSISHVKR